MTALQLASYILDKCIRDDYCITNLQLQKIMYFLKVNFDIEIFEDFQAWRFGPCIPKVYYEYSMYGAFPIDRVLTPVYQPNIEERMVIDRVVEYKRTQMPWDLNIGIMDEGSAWDVAFKKGDRSIIEV